MICRGCTSCFACRLRAKGVAVSPAATPNRRANRPQPYRRPDAPSWEAGEVSEPRPGGTRMPYLGADGKPLRVKEWGENRKRYEDRLSRLKRDPHVFAASAADPSKE